jgi:nucleoside-diphosphate-sugar epimerase
MSSRLLITGATGMIGSLLTQDLVARDVQFPSCCGPATRATGSPASLA